MADNEKDLACLIRSLISGRCELGIAERAFSYACTDEERQAIPEDIAAAAADLGYSIDIRAGKPRIWISQAQLFGVLLPALAKELNTRAAENAPDPEA